MDNKKCIQIYGRLSQSCSSGSGVGGIIPTGTKEINITENGATEYDVTTYAKAAVNVDVQKIGSKDIDITANGTTTENVQDVGSVNINVNVQTEKPTGSKAFAFTENGTYSEDVSDIATANITVNVAGQAADDWKYAFEKFIAGNVQDVGEWTLSVASVRQYAFYGASLPETVTIEGASKINQYGFARTSGVKTLNINSVTDVNQYAFEQATSLITINAESLINLNRYSISGCTNLETINAPNLKTIDTQSISSCENLKTINAQNLENIKGYAIYNCPMIEELYFPNLKILGNNALRVLNNLKKVTLGDAKFMDSSFVNCDALETLDVKTSSSISIPTSLSKSLIIRDITAVPTMSNTVSELKDTLNVYVPDDLVGAFKEATNWSAFGDRIKPLSEYVEL